MVVPCSQNFLKCIVKECSINLIIFSTLFGLSACEVDFTYSPAHEVIDPYADSIPEYELSPDAICSDQKNKGFGSRRTWRLTPVQIENSVRDILGVGTSIAKNFSDGLDVLGYSNNAQYSTVTESFMNSLEKSSKQVSADALFKKNSLLSCSSGDSSDRNCIETFINTKGRLFFRRDLSSQERSGLLAIYDNTKTIASADDAFEDVIRAMIYSPSFVYRTEIGDSVVNGVYQLSSYEIATAMAFAITNSAPDANLLDKAKNGALNTSSKIRNEAKLLLSSSKAKRGTRQFISEFLGINNLDHVSKSTEIISNFSQDLKNDMKEETFILAEDVIAKNGSLANLYSAPYTHVNSRLASHYGISAPGASNSNFVKVQPAGLGTAGVLSHGSVMSMYSTSTEPSPILRGKFVREKLLCDHLPDPPPGIPALPDIDPNLSIRDRFALHSSAPQCMMCHTMLDPIGFGFLKIDPVGRYQSTDGGGVINNSGEVINGGDASGSFLGTNELGILHGSSKKAGACYTINYFIYALGRGNTRSDRCEVANISKSFFESNMTVNEAILATLSSEAFRVRE